MIRVLHVIGAMDRAGAETLLMNLYRSIDRDQVQFDFLVHTERACAFDDEIEALGGRIYRIPRYNIANARSYRKAVRSFFDAHPEHAIVHGHIGSSAPIYISEASRSNRYTIAHSHNNVIVHGPADIVFKMMSKPVRGKADCYMACSREAGIDRFGKAIVDSDEFTILNNGIMVREFERDDASIRAAKEALGFDDVPVFGHIGRLTAQKNQMFLLDVFKNIKKELADAKLMLVGKGEDEEKLRRKANRLSLSDSVVFLGVTDDIPKALRAMDVFVFPSIYEGLGVSIIEAQTAGLQCVASDEIHDIAVLTDRMVRLPLGDANKWAAECIRAYDRSKDATDSQADRVAAAGFDIANTARWLQSFYLEHA